MASPPPLPTPTESAPEFFNNFAVFGWSNDSYAGKEQESSYTLLAGYVKGGEQAQVDITLDVISLPGTSSKLLYSYSVNFTVFYTLILHNRYFRFLLGDQ